eukprot:11947489-Karenia_brevis.AAC.1
MSATAHFQMDVAASDSTVGQSSIADKLRNLLRRRPACYHLQHHRTQGLRHLLHFSPRGRLRDQCHLALLSLPPP